MLCALEIAFEFANAIPYSIIFLKIEHWIAYLIVLALDPLALI
jgi:hypothetical protein